MRWIERKEQTIRRQIALAYWPVSIGGLEVRLQRIKAMLDRRRWSYRNQKRMDRLLALVAIHLNEQDDEERYVTLIERHLRANFGRPYWVRHAVYDRRAGHRCAARLEARYRAGDGSSRWVRACGTARAC